MTLLDTIRAAFATRGPPRVMYTSVELSPDELADVLAFQGLDPFSITTAFLRQHYAAVYYFSPEAFCYFLPGILSAGIRESEPDLLVYDALVASLDRSPEPEWWDGWFLDRWPHLTSAECEAVRSWLLWLTEFDNLECYVHAGPGMDSMDLVRARAVERESAGC